MLFLSDQLLRLCSFLSTLVCAAPSQGRFTASFATSTGISPVQDFLAYSSHQQPLTVSGSCPSGYTNCISFGNSWACCPPNAICSLDGAGHVACCPVNAVCTGVVGCPTSIPTTLVRTITVTRTTTVTEQCSSTVSYHLPVRRTLVAYSTGFQSHLLSLGGGFSSSDQSRVLLASTSSTTRDTQPTSVLNYYTPSRQDFQCPNGTASCTLLNPNVCCFSGETCQTVEDLGTDLGNVRCCPDGQTCGDLPSTCAPGYSSCPNSLGGGCCIPGFTCFGDGCILISTPTIVPTSSGTTVSSTPSFSIPTPSKSLPNCAYGPPCGYYSPQCCAIDEYCYVNPQYVAQCTTTNTGHWEPITTTYVTTSISTWTKTIPTIITTTEYLTSATTDLKTITTTWSTFECQYSLGETPCGNICCLAGQSCASAGYCTAGGEICASGWHSCAITHGGGCCPNGYVCGTSCTATTSSTLCTSVAGGGSTVPNAPYPFPYMPTSFANQIICSSYWTSCQKESASCFTALTATNGVTISNPKASSASASASASSACSQLSASACYHMDSPTICAQLPITDTSPCSATTTVPYQTPITRDARKWRKPRD
jgi:hypothetical protein